MEYAEEGEIARVIVRTPGFGGSAGIAVVGGLPYDERPFNLELMAEISKKLSVFPEAQAFTIMRSSLWISVRCNLYWGNTYEDFTAIATLLCKKPPITQACCDWIPITKKRSQLLVNIDRERAAELGVSIGDIGQP